MYCSEPTSESFRWLRRDAHHLKLQTSDSATYETALRLFGHLQSCDGFAMRDDLSVLCMFEEANSQLAQLVCIPQLTVCA